ncbi:MAG: COG1361 S-layer family protein [Nanoarchaeota archaeon]
MLILIAAHTIAVEGREAAGADIRVSLLNQMPDPVSAGRYVDVKYQILNVGNAPVSNFTIQIEDQFPFSIDNTDDAVKEIGSIGKLQFEEQGIIVEFRVRVDPNAIDGDNELRVAYSYTAEGRRRQLERTDTIRVRAADASLSIQEVTVQPDQVEPGKEGLVSVRVANLAKTNLRDISFKIDLSSDTLPIAPFGSATEKKIPLLLKGETATFTYRIVPYPSATAGVYKIPVTITFQDELNNEYVSNDVLGLKVGKEPDISVVVEEHELYKRFSQGTLPIKIINKGIVDVKFLDVFVQAPEGILLRSSEENYIGNLDSDDFETIDLQIVNQDTAQDQLQLPFKITYQDANNNEYEQSFDLIVPLRDQELVAPQQEGSNPVLYAVVAVVLIAAFIYWRKRKKSSNQQE